MVWMTRDDFRSLARGLSLTDEQWTALANGANIEMHPSYIKRELQRKLVGDGKWYGDLEESVVRAMADKGWAETDESSESNEWLIFSKDGKTAKVRWNIEFEVVGV